MSTPVIPGNSRLSNKQKGMLASSVAASPLTEHVKNQRAFVKENHDKKIRIPHFIWPLPRWTGSPANPPTLVDNVEAEPTFENRGPRTQLRCVSSVPEISSSMAALKTRFPTELGHVTIDRLVETAVGQDTNEPLIKAPHPDSDFSHVDSGTYDVVQKKQILDAVATIENLESLASKDGELADSIGQGNRTLANVRALLAANPRGMQRLKLVFEWTVCQVLIIFGEINVALNDGDKTKYNQALDKYIELLRDLDDHEPHTSGPPVPAKRGYGITIKWPSILPLIFNGKISGAIVEVKWNPHMSSSGIAIPH